MINRLILILILVFAVTTFSNSKTTLKIKDNNSVNFFDINKEGDKAPNFSLKSVKGKTVKLSDYKGKIVIVDFWATWCPPCRRGIPDLVSIQKKFKKDVVVIGISLDAEKTIKDVPAFVKNYKINYPILYGDEKVVVDYGGIQSIPTAFVIDRKGNIVDSHIGLADKDTYINEIKELLKKK